jgi:hypothetical protein
MKPIVALVGRPNVGKSTLFNRLTRSRDALVDDLPGVTRDRNYGDAEWDDIPFTVVDTGGFSGQVDDSFADAIREQVFQAIEDADAVIMIMDGKHGLSPFDAMSSIICAMPPNPFFMPSTRSMVRTRKMPWWTFIVLGWKRFIRCPPNIAMVSAIYWMPWWQPSPQPRKRPATRSSLRWWGGPMSESPPSSIDCSGSRVIW